VSKLLKETRANSWWRRQHKAAIQDSCWQDAFVNSSEVSVHEAKYKALRLFLTYMSDAVILQKQILN
jgi:hypothetical protein